MANESPDCGSGRAVGNRRFCGRSPDLGRRARFIQFSGKSPSRICALAANRTGLEGLFEILSGAVSLGGIFLIVLLMRNWSRFTETLARSSPGEALHRLWLAGWGFDRLYDLVLVHPYVWLARINRGDAVDQIYRGIGLAEPAWPGAA